MGQASAQPTTLRKKSTKTIAFSGPIVPFLYSTDCSDQDSFQDRNIHKIPFLYILASIFWKKLNCSMNAQV